MTMPVAMRLQLAVVLAAWQPGDDAPLRPQRKLPPAILNVAADPPPLIAWQVVSWGDEEWPAVAPQRYLVRAAPVVAAAMPYTPAWLGTAVAAWAVPGDAVQPQRYVARPGAPPPSVDNPPPLRPGSFSAIYAAWTIAPPTEFLAGLSAKLQPPTPGPVSQPVVVHASVVFTGRTVRTVLCQRVALYQGDLWPIGGTLTNGDGTPFDARPPATLEWKLEDLAGNLVVDLSLGAGIVATDAVNGLIAIPVSAAQTAPILPGQYRHQLRATDAAGNPFVMWTGAIDVRKSFFV